MIESIEFRNFKALRDTTLPLGPFTLIVGPNGSGKTTAARAIQTTANAHNVAYETVQSSEPTGDKAVQLIIRSSPADGGFQIRVQWNEGEIGQTNCTDSLGSRDGSAKEFLRSLGRYRMYTLEAEAVAQPVRLKTNIELASNGGNLAGVLDRLRDRAPERWEAFNEGLGEWFPEFDHVLFDVEGEGLRVFQLRTRQGEHKIAAPELSQGTLLALTMLTIAYLPEAPPIVCFEDPDRGIHPRLLTNIRDALYRLAYPEDHGESREPVQVIATTHSPYFLDLFKDHPEEIVIAEKVGPEARFHRLADRSDLDELLGKASLGEIWYTGILGGVPAAP